jgi:hypothetical protein
MLPRVELEPLVEYELDQFAKENKLDQEPFKDFIRDQILRQIGVEKFVSMDKDGHTEQWKEGYKEGWEDCEESADIEFGICPY